jgi:hypothetical protein
MQREGRFAELAKKKEDLWSMQRKERFADHAKKAEI